MITLDRSHETLLAVCDCGARSCLATRANAHLVDSWVVEHARAHEASRSATRAVYASQLRSRRRAEGAPIERKVSPSGSRIVS